ncbi:BolA family protein [Eionea flava]
MEPDVIKSLLEQHINAVTIEVEVEGSHVALRIVSSEFDGLNTLKRQQNVYAALSQHIASGVIHAVNMKTLTPEEAG